MYKLEQTMLDFFIDGCHFRVFELFERVLAYRTRFTENWLRSLAIHTRGCTKIYTSTLTTFLSRRYGES
jgi:hypothetical protein